MFTIRSGGKNISLVTEVEIDEYICEPYFIGKSTNNGKLVYDIWKKDLKDMFDSKTITEVILTGAIGTGKSTTAVIAMSYIAYRILLLDNPHKHFKMIEKDPIAIAFINLTRSLSKSGCATKFANLVNNSPVFSKLGTKFATRTEVPWPKFPKNLEMVLGSSFAKGFGVVGSNVITGALDEISEVTDAKQQAEKLMFSQQKALKLYRTVAQRITSRFMNKTHLAKLFLVSSKSKKDMFLEKYVKKVENMEHVAVYDHPLWEAKPSSYSGKKFYVSISKIKQIKLSNNINKLPKDSDIYEIPVEHKNEFKLDPITALADFAGISTNMDKSYFFRNKVLLQKAFSLPLIHQETYVLNTNDDSSIERAFDMRKLMKLKDLEKPLSLHIDTGLTNDRFALGASYVDSYEKIEYTPEANTLSLLTSSNSTAVDDDDTDSVKAIFKDDHTMLVPTIKIPIAIGFDTLDEIPFFKVREFIVFLRNLGFKIVSITTDGWQSVDMRQLLQKEKFHVELLSLDKTTAPYNMFRTFIYNKRLFLPRSKLLYRECAKLLDFGKKIDHPVGGSKDAVDTAAGSAFHWIVKKNNKIPVKDRMTLYKLGMKQDSVIDKKNKAIKEILEDGNKKYVPKIII